MNITFDSAKDVANQAKHGVSLSLAEALEWSHALVKPDTRKLYGEIRLIGCAPIGARVYCVVFVDRDDIRRISAFARPTAERSSTMRNKSKFIIPTPEEDATINAGIASDPDTYELTAAEFTQLRPVAGRPKSTVPLKVPTTIRFDADVLATLKSTGKGWQTRVNEAVREWLKTHSPA